MSVAYSTLPICTVAFFTHAVFQILGPTHAVRVTLCDRVGVNHRQASMNALEACVTKFEAAARAAEATCEELHLLIRVCHWDCIAVQHC